jgi:ABC-type multidrug transport system ATPase subunit|tara:strand:- start:1459 stop:2079 length:621 start_codon:yes stop_codon:yes gene_type:complete
MEIQLQSLAKRFNKEWVFKEVSLTFNSGSRTGVVGSNGSGKSTLIRLISAAELPSKGEITYKLNNTIIEQEDIYQSITYAAPYIDLVEEFTGKELVQFHLNFKPFQENLTAAQFLELIYLQDAGNKHIKNFSSGMKQRLKLGLAICSKSDLLLLDEPCSNLDAKGIKLYHTLLRQFNQNRTTIIGSNEQTDELYSTEKTIRISDYK